MEKIYYTSYDGISGVLYELIGKISDDLQLFVTYEVVELFRANTAEIVTTDAFKYLKVGAAGFSTNKASAIDTLKLGLLRNVRVIGEEIDILNTALDQLQEE